MAAALFASGGFALGATSAQAAGYVGAELGDVAPEKKAVVAKPAPVQLIYAFATKGAPNKPGTKQTREQVLAAVKDSGFFSEVSDSPTPNGAILSIVLDNVVPDGALTNAAAKGALTGATFFIAGSNTREHYKATVEYVANPEAAKISKTANHSIVFQMGLINSAPDNAVKVDGGVKGSLNTMIRQIVSNPLNEVAKDPGFAPAAVAPPAEAAPAPPVAPATSAEPATETKPVAQ